MAEGLHASARGNAQAFGYSITVTVTFGVVAFAEPEHRPVQLLVFALAAVLAFSLLNVVVALGLRRMERTRPGERALLIGTATDILAVGAAVGVAMGLSAVVRGTALWALAPFVAGVVYVLVQAIELAVGREEIDEDD